MDNLELLITLQSALINNLNHARHLRRNLSCRLTGHLSESKNNVAAHCQSIYFSVRDLDVYKWGKHCAAFVQYASNILQSCIQLFND